MRRLDGLVTYRLWRELGFPPENTLHDLRWGQHYQGDGVDDYVWVFLISGAAPPAHFIGGWKGAVSERQPPMYFRLGGGTLKGISKTRANRLEPRLHHGRQTPLRPRRGESRRTAAEGNRAPLARDHAAMAHHARRAYGITRDQMMARHKSNHIQVVYAPDEKQAHRACRIKAAMLAELGLEVHLCGNVNLE